MKYRRHLVRELPFITNRELKYVVAIFQKTADGLNLLKITPSTMKEFTDRHREKFPVEELEQQELGVEA